MDSEAAMASANEDEKLAVTVDDSAVDVDSVSVDENEATPVIESAEEIGSDTESG